MAQLRFASGAMAQLNLCFELPGADLSHEELAVEVKPRQEDEFTCMSCFLVHHRSQLAKEVGGTMICTRRTWPKACRL